MPYCGIHNSHWVVLDSISTILALFCSYHLPFIWTLTFISFVSDDQVYDDVETLLKCIFPRRIEIPTDKNVYKVQWVIYFTRLKLHHHQKLGFFNFDINTVMNLNNSLLKILFRFFKCGFYALLMQIGAFQNIMFSFSID